MPAFVGLRIVLRLRMSAFRLAILAAAIWVAPLLAAPIATTPTAAVIIKDDHGGNIGAYWSRYTALRDIGAKVVIDGTCSSACTLVVGIVPYDRICVTRHAQLGFHAAWRPGFLGIKVINEPGTSTLLSFYPTPIRNWIARNGGLGFDMMYLSGTELLAMYKECR
jgi:hypothetical protein